jgi:D-threo-aldose 1-dehydrogenase
MNQTKSLTRFVNEVDLDCLLLAGRYTVLDHASGADLLQLCCEKNVGVVLGGIFNSGLLADPDKNKTFDYVDATPEILQKANAIAELARSHGFSLPHVAVQFGLRNASVASIVIGARTAREISQDLLYATQEIPTTFWDDLQSLS